MNKPKLSFALILLILLLLIALFGLFWHQNARNELKDGKNGDIDRYGKKETYEYYSKKTIEILNSKGIIEALKYVNETVSKNAGYGLTHMIIHIIGHEAYHKTGSLKKAMSYLPECSFTEECFWDYDGYQHGVFQSFFDYNRNVKPVSELMQQACSEYYNSTLLASNNVSKRLISTQCFHALGHALMSLNNNDVFRSLSDCEKLPEEIMKDRCFYGVFMENSYLQIPYYEPNAPRPFAADETITICKNVKDNQKLPCSNFVAWSMLIKGEDINKSFGLCFELEEKYRRPCVSLAAKHFIPNLLRDNFTGMIETCENLGPYEEICIAGIAAGIRQRGAGAQYKNFPFCDIVNAKFKKSCLNSV